MGATNWQIINVAFLNLCSSFFRSYFLKSRSLLPTLALVNNYLSNWSINKLIFIFICQSLSHNRWFSKHLKRMKPTLVCSFDIRHNYSMTMNNSIWSQFYAKFWSIQLLNIDNWGIRLSLRQLLIQLIIKSSCRTFLLVPSIQDFENCP